MKFSLFWLVLFILASVSSLGCIQVPVNSLDAISDFEILNQGFDSVLSSLVSPTKLSFCVEGTPHKGTWSFHSRCSLRSLFDQLTAVFDYKWQLSKLDTVIFSKTFLDEHDTPEVSPAEIRESISIVNGLISDLYIPDLVHDDFYLLAEMKNKLSAAELLEAQSDTGISFGSLSMDARSQANHMLYKYEFFGFVNALKYLDDCLSKMDFADLTLSHHLRKGSRDLMQLYYNYPLRQSNEYQLWDNSGNIPIGSYPIPVDSQDDLSKSNAGILVAHNLAEFAQQLKTSRFERLTIAKSIRERAILVICPRAKVDSMIHDIAILHGWDEIITNASGITTHHLRKKPASRCRSFGELRTKLLEALPQDIVRFCTEAPSSVGGKKPSGDPEIYESFFHRKYDSSGWNISKIQFHKSAAILGLLGSVGLAKINPSIKVKLLSPWQKKQLATKLLMDHLYYIAQDLWHLKYRSDDMAEDPDHTRLKITSDSSYSLIGPMGSRTDFKMGRVPRK